MPAYPAPRCIGARHRVCMYNCGMGRGATTVNRTIRSIVVALFILLLSAFTLAPLSCGNNKPKPDGSNPGDTNFAVREAVTDALETDKALDDNARNIIGLVRSGGFTIDKGLNDLVDQTRTLLAVIASVAAPAKPGNADLAQARKLLEQYLRNRVHQLEASISARSAAELEVIYNRDTASLNAARDQVKQLLLEYDPGLAPYLK